MPAVLRAGIPRKIKINRQTALNHNRARIFEARSIPSDIHRYFPSPCRRSSPAKRCRHEKSIDHPLSSSRSTRVSIHRSRRSTFITLNSPVLHWYKGSHTGLIRGQFVDCIVQNLQVFISRMYICMYMCRLSQFWVDLFPFLFLIPINLSNSKTKDFSSKFNSILKREREENVKTSYK